MQKTADTIKKQIDSLLAEQGHVLVAIDGSCTSGKTTLAAELEKQYDCNVLHMDDFFLRPEQRTADRLLEIGGNVDYERFREEVLQPLQAGMPFSFRPFSCRTGMLADPVEVIPKPVTIVEGTYSHHPYFGDAYDLKVYLTVSEKVRTERIRQRPAFLHKRFFEEWIPMEQQYFSHNAISENSHITAVPEANRDTPWGTIRNILFDMGNVLIYFDRNLFMERLGVSEEDRKLLMREVFLSVEWVRMDRGSLVEESALECICRRLPERLHDAAQKLVSMWDRPILPIPGMYELIEELKTNGYGIYLLSNASLRQHEYWPRIPASRFFDGTLISADEGVIKPQPEIYRLILDRFQLKAEECFFIDDVPANIEGAFYCGIPGAVFHDDVALLRKNLRDAGVQIGE